MARNKRSSRGRGGRSSRSSSGVAMKFSLATSLVVAGAMLVFTPILYTMVAGVLSDEIDEAGVLASRAMAAVDLGAWKLYDQTVLEGQEEQYAYVAVQPTLKKEQIDPFKAQRDANKVRAASIADSKGTKILDAAILDFDKKRVINGQGAIRFTPSGRAREIDGVIINEGKYDLGGKKTGARTYTAPIRNAKGEVSGYAVVALSESKIGKTLRRLLTLMALVAVIFVGLGLVVSWMVAQKITRPILALTEDIEIVAEGDLEHRTHATSQDEIGAMARTFDRMTQNLLAASELERKQAAQEHAMGIATQVQESLFPKVMPQAEGYEFAADVKVAHGVSGHYYDTVELDNGDILFALGSASGGGMAGALVVTMGRSLVKAVAESESSPAAALRKVNRMLAPDLRRGMYVSVLLVLLKPSAGKAVVANAGHPPLMVIRGNEAQNFHCDGIALGFDKGPVFDRTIKDTELEIQVGDRLVLLTRSMLEVKNPQGEQLGEKRLMQAMGKESRKNSQVFIPMVMHALQEFQGDEAHDEDLALLTIKRLS